MEKENTNEVLGKINDVINQKPILLEVDVKPINKVHEFLIRKKIFHDKKIFKIAPCTLGTLIKISHELIDIDLTGIDERGYFQSGIEFAEKYGQKLAKTIAFSIVNRKKDPSEHLVSFILENFTPKDILKTLSIVLRQMDMMGFMTSIISVKGMSLMNPKEIIANGESSLIPGK